MTEKRFTIEVLDKNNWLIEDTKTGETANPIDGTTNVLKGLISTLNKFNDENEELKSRVDYLKRKIQRERASAMKQHEKWEKELKSK